MRNIGQILNEARTKKGISLKKLESITKIKKSFLVAIEDGEWKNLPEFPVVVGFVKNFASAVGVDETLATSSLRRDYPPQDLPINPKPDVVSKFSWSPKLTFYVGFGLVAVLVFSYIAFQYNKFISPPSLTVNSPVENAVITQGSVLVSGTTDSDGKVTVNNQPTLIDDTGVFSVTIEVSPETKEIVVKAVSRSGRESTVKRKIEVSS